MAPKNLGQFPRASFLCVRTCVLMSSGLLEADLCQVAKNVSPRLTGREKREGSILHSSFLIKLSS